MAQKIHQIDFVMNAVLNGGFHGTFSKAGEEVTRLTKEIQALNRVRADISAYQKQQTAVQQTTAKLENLRQQETLLRTSLEQAKSTAEYSANAYMKLQQESAKLGQENTKAQAKLEAARKTMEKDASTVTSLEREHLKLNQQIQNTTNRLEQQNQKLSNTQNRLQVAGVATDQLARKDAELSIRLQELHAQQTQVNDSAAQFQTTASEAFQAVGQALAAAGITVGLREVAGAFQECVRSAAEFDAALSGVEAISSASMSELAALKQEAKDLGASTVFTAQQSADAMQYMAMAGWDAQEMLAGTSGMLNLAAAAGEDLAMVSDMVTDNLTAFGLSASDTAHFADVLAQTAANANTNIAMMGETFKRSASVAGALGYSIEDVSVMIGTMANAGIKGSRADTALVNIFTGLLNGTTLTGRAFGEYEVSAIRADGSMKGLMNTARELRDVFGQMSESEKVLNAKEIAGLRGYAGLLSIINADEESFQALYDDIENCNGAAERMAKIKLDNLAGDVKLLQSAWEAVKITIGEQLTPAARIATQGLTALTTSANEFLQNGSALVPIVTSLTVGLTAFAGVMTTIKVVVPLVRKAISLLNKAMLDNPYTAVAAGAAAVVSGLVTFALTAQDAETSVHTLTEAVRDAETALADAQTALQDTENATAATASVAEQYIANLQELEQVTNRTDTQNQQYHNTLVLLNELIPDVAESIDLETDAIEGGTAALLDQVNAWKKNAEEQARQDYMQSVTKDYNELLVERTRLSEDLTQAENKGKIIEKEREDILKRMTALSREASEGNLNAQQEYSDLERTLQQYNEEQRENDNLISNLTTAIGEYDSALADLGAKMQAAAEEFSQLNGSIDGQYDSIEDVLGALDDLSDGYQAAYDVALESFQKQFTLFEEAQINADATVEKVQQSLDSQVGYWEQYNADVAILQNTTAEQLGITEEEYNSLLHVIQTGTDEAIGLMDSVVKHLQSGDTESVKQFAETLVKLDTVQKEAADKTAGWVTELNQQMNELLKSMNETVQKMDFSEDARKSAEKTIQAYIRKVGNMESEISRAYARLVDAAQQGLNSKTLTMPAVTTSTTTVTPYATGGILTQPHIGLVAEAGPEAIIPLSSSKRKRGAEVWEKAGKLMGLLPAPAGQLLPVAQPMLEMLQPLSATEKISQSTVFQTLTVPTVFDCLRELQTTEKVFNNVQKQEIIKNAGTVQQVIEKIDRQQTVNHKPTLTAMLKAAATPTVFDRVRELQTTHNTRETLSQPVDALPAMIPPTVPELASAPSIGNAIYLEKLPDHTTKLVQTLHEQSQPPRLADFPQIFKEHESKVNNSTVTLSPQIVLQFNGNTSQEIINEIQEFSEKRLRGIVQNELQEAYRQVSRGAY